MAQKVYIYIYIDILFNDMKPPFTLHDATIARWLEPNPPARCCQLIHWCRIGINLRDCSRGDAAATAVISLEEKGVLVRKQVWKWQTTKGKHQRVKEHKTFCWGSRKSLLAKWKSHYPRTPCTPTLSSLICLVIKLSKEKSWIIKKKCLSGILHFRIKVHSPSLLHTVVCCV